MNLIVHLILSLGLAYSWGVLIRGYFFLRGTTLVTGWFWGIVAASAWTSIWFTDQFFGCATTSFADHAWYAATILALCPPIAVLGSRRPGTRVWTWFIIFPMLLVLGWPVLALWAQGSELRGLQLETPQLAAFCLVLIMGIGNYCGTRFTLSALLYACSLFLIVLSTSVIAPEWLSNRSMVRLWSTVMIVTGVYLLERSPPQIPKNRFDDLWFDFFDCFGIVWGRRIQNRVNYIIQKEGLPVTLELEGFVWVCANRFPLISDSDHAEAGNALAKNEIHRDSTTIDTERRLEHILRWLLRRFVDHEWIDSRLKTDCEATMNKFTIDS